MTRLHRIRLRLTILLGRWTVTVVIERREERRWGGANRPTARRGL